MSRFNVILIAAVLTALAGLIGQAALVASGRAETWETRLAGEMTVAIRPSEAAVAGVEARRAAEVLAGTEGVAEVRVLAPARVAQLLSPWTAGARGPDLEVLPRLIAVELDARRPASRQDLASTLSAAGIDAVVDDHQGWLRTGEAFRREILTAALSSLILCAIGLAALGSLAAGHEIARRGTALKVRIQLGATWAACLLQSARPVAVDLISGALVGGLAAVGIAGATGLLQVERSLASAVHPALQLAGLIGIAGGVAIASALASAARRIREFDL